MHPSTHNPTELYGKSVDHPDVVQFLSVVDPDEKAEPMDDQVFWSSKRAGFELEVDPASRRITVVAAFGDHDGYGHYQYLPPDGVIMGTERAEVQRDKGAPSKSGPRYDTWDSGSYLLSVRYNDADRVCKVTVFG